MAPTATDSAGADDHYFSAVPRVDADARTVRLVVDGQAYELASSTGVFSAERVDAGTSVLVQSAPRPPTTGTLLDLGAGYGPIACALALRSPEARVVAVDVNERAVALVEANAKALGLNNIQAYATDNVPADLRFDAIYSNPPIRVGKAALHELLTCWLRRLADGGTAYLVVHRNLGSDSLTTWLADAGWSVRRLVSVRGYRILEVRARTSGDQQ